MTDKSESFIGCGCMLVIAINLVIGGLCTHYVLAMLFHVNIPFIADAIIGLVGGGITIPVAIIVWILDLCGVL